MLNRSLVRSSDLSPRPDLLAKFGSGSVWAITPQGWDGLRNGILSGVDGGMRAMAGEADPERIKARVEHSRVKGALWDEDDHWFNPLYDPHIRASGIGVLPVRGPLFDRGWMCYQGYDQIRAALQEFAAEFYARQEIGLEALTILGKAPMRGVVMPIDSPGGMCAGLWDVCEDMRALRELFPIWTVADYSVGSAAEAIACQGSESFCSRDTTRGHVGTWCDDWDISALLVKEGISHKYYHRPEGGVKTFFAGDETVDPEARRKAADEVYNRLVDHYWTSFVEMVSLGRGMTPAEVVALRAQIYPGNQAIEAGLATGEATLDQLLYTLESDDADIDELVDAAVA